MFGAFSLEAPEIPGEYGLEWTRLSALQESGGFDSPSAREGHAVTAIGDRMYLFGGMVRINDLSIESSELFEYNRTTGTWQLLGGNNVHDICSVTSPTIWPKARAGATLSALGESLYLFGGMSAEGWLNDFECFDLRSQEWSVPKLMSGSLPTPREGHGSAVVGSKLVIFGGFGPVVKGDESEDESGEADDIDDVGNITGSNLTLTGSEDSNVPPCLELIRFGDVHIFDANAGSFTVNTPSGFGPTPRTAHGMCAIGSDIIIVGGRDTLGRQNDLYILDMGVEPIAWRSLLPSGRKPPQMSFHSCCKLKNDVIVFGGRCEDDTHSTDLFIFNVASGSWNVPLAVTGPCRTPTEKHSACTVGDSVLFFGGGTDFDPQLQCCRTVVEGLFSLISREQISKGVSPLSDKADTKRYNDDTDDSNPKRVHLV